MKLKEIFKIQEVLKKAGYFDISRISNEIYTYSIQHNIPLDSILERISKQEPWEYIRGFTIFRERKFLITKDTLIPRIESEQLVDISLDLIRQNGIRKVIDVGTGSGCLIISIAEEIQNENIDFLGIDISEKALDIAKQNDVQKKVVFKNQDLIKGEDLDDNTLVVANLPYIPTDMYEKLDKSVKGFEPKLALDGGFDGLEYYKKLIGIIKDSKKNILLLIEIEPSTLNNLREYTEDIPTEDIPMEVFKDFRERERFVLFHFS